MVDWGGSVKVKGNGELDGIQGTELTTQPVFADEFPGHFEVGVEHSQGANQAAVDVGPQA